MSVWVKICGVRSVEDALHAQACGADAVGLNLHPPSVRCLDIETAAAIAEAVDIETVLVVVDRSEEELSELVAAIGPSRVQLHGEQPPGFGAWLGVSCFRAFRARPGVLEAIPAHGHRRFLLDAYVPGEAGGTGRRVDLELAAAAARLGELILAGGLKPDNVGAAIAAVRPWGVDVASGVESAPGVKDPAAVEAFVAAARASAQGLARP